MNEFIYGSDPVDALDMLKDKAYFLAYFCEAMQYVDNRNDMNVREWQGFNMVIMDLAFDIKAVNDKLMLNEGCLECPIIRKNKKSA